MVEKILKNQWWEYWFKGRVRASYNLGMDQVRSDEKVVDVYLSYTKDIGKCIVAITDKRLILAHKKLVGSKVKSISFKDISDAYMNQGLISTKIVLDFLGDRQYLIGYNKEHSKLYKTLSRMI